MSTSFSASLFLIIIMYIYHALIVTLSAHMIHINLDLSDYVPSGTQWCSYHAGKLQALVYGILQGAGKRCSECAMHGGLCICSSLQSLLQPLWSCSRWVRHGTDQDVIDVTDAPQKCCRQQLWHGAMPGAPPNPMSFQREVICNENVQTWRGWLKAERH